jgi:F0F1-type ATP synthase delta subunit
MATLSNRHLADLLVAQCEDVTRAELTKIIDAFVQELTTRGWMHRWRDIEYEIHGAWKRKYGAANITIVSAHPLATALRKSIEAAAPGADIVERVDERLMGGAVIRIDDRRIDASVAGSLQRLKLHLEKSL